MASGNGNVENGEPQTPEKIAPRASSRENSPVTQPPGKNLPDNCSAVQAGKKRRHAKAAKKSAQKHMKDSKKRRSKSRRYSSSSSSPSSSSSATSSSTSDSDSEATSRPASRVNESLFSRSTSSAKGENTVSEEIAEELHWWLAHLNAWNGRALLHPPPDIVIETDASRTGWGGGGAVCQGVETRGFGLRWRESFTSIAWNS